MLPHFAKAPPGGGFREAGAASQTARPRPPGLINATRDAPTPCVPIEIKERDGFFGIRGGLVSSSRGRQPIQRTGRLRTIGRVACRGAMPCRQVPNQEEALRERRPCRSDRT